MACSDLREPESTTFEARIPQGIERVWVGPEFYANRLQDWRIRDGRIENVEGRAVKPMRTLHLLTRSLKEGPGTLTMSVRTGPLEEGPAHQDTWSGFLVGVGGGDVDYRISALSHHWPSTDGGLIVAVDGTGAIVVRDNSVNRGIAGPRADIPLEAWPLVEPAEAELIEEVGSDVVLELQAAPEGQGSDTYRLTVTARNAETSQLLARSAYTGIPAHQLSGNVALASHRSPGLEGPGYWFRDWSLEGTKVERHDDRAFGPVMGTMYTLSGGTLKMTAQMGPLGEGDFPTARLELLRDGHWIQADEAQVQPLSWTAHFRVEGWEGETDVPYRVAYDLVERSGVRTHTYQGTVRSIPPADQEFVLGVIGCFSTSGADGQWNHNHFWFPHTDVLESLAHHDPDLLFSYGDQIYEAGLEGVVREPTEVAALDYLAHWYRFVWSFRDVMRDRPTIAIPDDHDAYHGNIWGNAGIREEGPYTVQDRGGYRMEPEWVNAMHRTQVANLPDPVDPEPLANGITVYHSRVEYGGISFAVLADRMWKSPPAVMVPEGAIVNGWSTDPDFDAAARADVPGAVLLGERQLRFLEEWAADWSNDAWMKVVLSQSPFADVATIPEEAMSGAVLPSSYVAMPGEYLEGEKKAADMDSNGWPQSGRDRAIRAMRKGFAFHVAGDQHLPFFARYGVDTFGDAGHVLTAPAGANLWPRRWFPPEPGTDPMPWSPRNTGDYFDGLGNRVTVLAVANPRQVGVEPTALTERVPGYGILRFRPDSREIVVENWPRWVDPALPGAEPFSGWPMTVTQEEQYGRPGVAHLPTLVVEGMTNPVVQVTDEEAGEILYTLRIRGDRFRPKIFRAGGRFTVTVGEPGTDRMARISGVTPAESPEASLEVRIPSGQEN
jgi:phosphodiesterase/alkaline phosphatase D-like protein